MFWSFSPKTDYVNRKEVGARHIGISLRVTDTVLQRTGTYEIPKVF